MQDLLNGKDRRKVAALFSSIVDRYDLLNRILSLGQDQRWRRKLVEALLPAERLLDLACGTGDVALIAMRRGAGVVGLDASLEMLEGAVRKGFERVVVGDAMRLPFRDGSFDAVACAFGIRNFPSVAASFREIYRVLKPGGRIGVLEFSKPRCRLLRMLHGLYLSLIVPSLGRLLSPNPEAYLYLSRSIKKFMEREQLASLLTQAGFKSIKFFDLTLGAVVLATGRKS